MNSEIERRVDRFVEDLRAAPVSRDVEAVVVAGSAAREEERWVDGRLASDIDVMVISRSSPARVDRTRAVQRVVATHAGAGIEGGRVPMSTLRYASLANYEARHGGIVVDGPPAVLRRIPMQKPSDLPVWEAVRLLANRLFEHLKHHAGMISAEATVLKTYEAIGESQLVLEGRYRPSFRERVDEMRRMPLEGAVRDASTQYAACEPFRRGQARIDLTPAQALPDLLAQLDAAFVAFHGARGSLAGHLGALARSERHLSQRAYWLAIAAGRGDPGYLPNVDPIIRLWGAALDALKGRTVAKDADRLVRLWQQCPQILRELEPS